MQKKKNHFNAKKSVHIEFQQNQGYIMYKLPAECSLWNM